MKVEWLRPFRYVATSCLILVALSGADCGSVIPTKCDTDPGPNNAYNTISGTFATFSDNQSSAFDNTTTYSMTIADPDPYIRWNDDGTLQFGYQILRCFGEAWEDMHGAEEVPALIFAGSEQARCGSVQNLQVASLAGVGIVTATVTVRGTLGSGYLGSVAIVLNKSCPPGSCAGKSGLSTQCFAPFASISDISGGVSVPGADMNFVSMDGADLGGSDFRGVSLTHASATGANLRDANFNGAVIIDVDFTDADMRGVSWGSARLLQVTAPDGELVNSSEALEAHLVD